MCSLIGYHWLFNLIHPRLPLATGSVQDGVSRQTMSQATINLDFSKNEEELNTIKYEGLDETIPRPLAELLARILRRSKSTQNTNSMSTDQESIQQSNHIL
jgi:hypothetical protein